MNLKFQTLQVCYFVTLFLILIFFGCAKKAEKEVVKKEVPDKEQILSVAKKSMENYEKKDLEGLMELWSKKSPGYIKQRNLAKHDFENMRDIKLKNLSHNIKKLSEDEAILETKNRFTGKVLIPVDVSQENETTIYFKKEKGEWKIWDTKIKVIKEEKMKDK